MRWIDHGTYRASLKASKYMNLLEKVRCFGLIDPDSLEMQGHMS